LRLALFETLFYPVEMIIDLTKSADREIDFDERIEPSKIDLDEPETLLAEPVEIKGNVKKGIVQVDVEGDIKARIKTNCSRCFEKSEVNLQFPFRAAFVTEENYTQASEAEIRNDDLDVSIYDGERIDLTEIAREQILLNLPTQNLCRENCKGLCEKCGANLNETVCGCETKEIDPRWAGLKNLR
jgi:uncharacterized protein